MRVAVGLSLGGSDAPYFVGGTGAFGDDHDKSVREYNLAPEGQPGLWCHWKPTDDDEGIEWDGTDKFSGHKEWLCYIVEHFLEPWGYVLSGSVEWQGRNEEDRGTVVVVDNDVRTAYLPA